MKRVAISMLIAVSLLTACAVVPAGRGHRSGVMIAPILPPVVVLETEPYYFYGDFYYHYTNDRWFYSRSRNGPWADLPRDHYPKEVRFKGKNDNRDRGRDNDRRNDDRGRDDRSRNDRDRDDRDR
ncbi:MAG: hypothetical protein P8130_10730 [Deltaproteobacteria bacterium]